MINNQLYLFLIYVISGIAIGIVFDLFRVLRKSIKTSNLITYIEDTIFWIIVGSFLIWEIFTVSYGELRSYIFIGLLVGFAIYLVAISKYFIKINVRILDFVKRIIFKVIRIAKIILNFFIRILNPLIKFIKKIANCIYIKLKKISNFSNSQIAKSKKKLFKNSKIVKKLRNKK